MTTLAITNSGGHLVSEVNYGNPITLTAQVKNYSGTDLPLGTVVFCDGSVPACLDGHSIGSSQIVIVSLPPPASFAGLARITIWPTAGTHTYSAVFLGTDAITVPFSQPAYLTSTSAPSFFQVLTPPYPGVTTTTLASTGTVGNYTLNAKVVGSGAGYDPLTATVTFTDITAGKILGTKPLGATSFTFSFGSPLVPTIPPAPFFFELSAVADVNNDGFPDLILVTEDPITPYQFDIFVLLGKGDGTFMPFPNTPASTFTTAANPLAIVTGDFNNDGNVDLAISTDDGHIFTFTGTGLPVFANIDPPISLPTFMGSMAVADLAHSGYQSIVGITPLGLQVLQNDHASFPHIAFSVGPILGTVPPGWNWPASIALGDFNNDGWVDAAVTNYATNNVTFWIGNGAGGFSQGPSKTVGNGPSAVVVADFNGDGNQDVAVTNSLDKTVSILMGDGNLNFTYKPLPATGPDPQFLTTGDFNDDGKTDLAVGNLGNGSVTVLLGGGDGSFPVSKKYTLSDNVQIGVLAADFNSDGFTDIAAVSNLTPEVFLSEVLASANASLSGVAILGASGTHQANASYPGNTWYIGSTSNNAPLMAAPLATNLGLTALPSPGTWGQMVTLTATLSPYQDTIYSLITDGQLVSFYDGMSFLGHGTLSSGVATFTTSALAVGAHTLKAVYGGNTYFAGSSITIPFTVNPATSSVLLAAANIHPVVGAPDLLTATVTGFSAPRGNVEFTVNGTTICTAYLTAFGTATCYWTPWTTDVAHIVATYDGDINHTPGTSNTLTFTPIYTFDSQVVLTVDNTVLTYPGQTQTVTCVARGSNRTPTGSVIIFDDLNPIQTIPVGGDGCAYWYINPGLHAGLHHIRAWYSGDRYFWSGYSAITIVYVHQLTTYWSVQCPQNINHGQNEVCSIAIWSNVGPPPGVIDYSYDAGPPQTAHINNGNATIVIPTPSYGYHNIVLAYPGTNDLAPIPAQTENFYVSH